MILLVVAPPREHAVYLQTVAAFARALSRPELAAALLAARSADEVLALPGLRQVELEGQLLVRDLMRADRRRPPARRHARRGRPAAGSARRSTALPVVGEAGQVVGLLSHRELLKALAPGARAAGDGRRRPTGRSPGIRVRDAMARSVLCVSEDQTAGGRRASAGQPRTWSGCRS